MIAINVPNFITIGGMAVLFMLAVYWLQDRFGINIFPRV